MQKLDTVIKASNTLVDAPYNQFNLDNYAQKISDVFGCSVPAVVQTAANGPIKLMSGQHANAGIVVAGNLKAKRRIIIVGKGMLFDAGGYNIKREMSTMKSDMAGLAMACAVQFNCGKNVVAYCPVTTNFLHNNQITPGDIIPIGKRDVEIADTDAEGRLVIAEALSHLSLTKKDIVITLATLTGAVTYAVGSKATGVFSPNDALVSDYLEASDLAGEYAWRLPLWDYLEKEFKRNPLPNYTKTQPGATTGAMFIKEFVPYPERWIHLDVAASSFDDTKRKATGVPIKSLVEFIRILE